MRVREDGDRVEDVRDIHDVDVLWKRLMGAKTEGDHELVRVIEGRMRELTEERRFAHLTDAELDARIAGLRGERAPKGLLGHSPGGKGEGGAGWGGEDILAFNQAIKANQHAGIEATLTALEAERDRRRAG